MIEGGMGKFGHLVGQVREAGWFVQNGVCVDSEVVDIEIGPLEAATTEGDDSIRITYKGRIGSTALSALIEVLPELLPRDIDQPII